MLIIPEIDEIAKRATERIAKDFAESGFINPPIVTHGIARAVLEAAEQMFAPDQPSACPDFGSVDEHIHYANCPLAKTAGR